MNAEHSLSLIRKRFGASNVHEVAPNTYRAERHANGAFLSVSFFDFAQRITEQDFNLDEYLHTVLATDFYSHEGSLQWNYYLYFVLDEPLFKRLSEQGKTTSIEAHRAFARKFVVTERLLEKELTAPLIDAIVTAEPPRDIAATWRQELTKQGLAKICDPKATYTEIVKDILLGATETVDLDFSARPLIADEVGPITTVKIKKFRERSGNPNKFDFGQVNLIRGPNGAGKTSLLEALELCLCGGIMRQDGKRPSGAQLEITFKGQNRAQMCPQRGNALYQARDLAWYGQYNRIGNQLCYNFGRFNFFDSDAAFRLSSATTVDQIENAIGSLFLGHQVNTLEERMIAIEERLDNEKRQRQGD